MLKIKKIEPTFYFKELNSMWREILHLGQLQYIEKGHRWENDHNASVFSFLDKGTVRLDAISFSGFQRIIFYLSDGTVFREVKNIIAEENIMSSFVALENCTVYHFPAELINDMDFIRTYPRHFLNIISSMGKKMGSLLSLFSETSFQTAEEGVAIYIDKLSRVFDKDTFDPNISQAELALTVGVHRSTFCKVIKDFKEQGILGEVSKHKIEILNKDKLKSYFEQDDDEKNI